MGAAIKPDPFESTRPSHALFLDASIILKHSSSLKCRPLPSSAVQSGASRLTSLGLHLYICGMGLSLCFPVDQHGSTLVKERVLFPGTSWNSEIFDSYLHPALEVKESALVQERVLFAGTSWKSEILMPTFILHWRSRNVGLELASPYSNFPG